MEATLIEKLAIDKTNWKKVKFGDVVFEPKESVQDPVKAGVQHVVGLEHIDSENIHLTRSASIEESTTFTKCFSESDVLFGRRRAYLKKAAQASFSGICSGDITVFRAKESLLSELLPFVVNSEKFFDYAVKHSAGGLSPRVKFKDLANYEFLLPPKEEQAKLAELLWAMDEVIEKEKGVRDNLESVVNSYRFFEIENLKVKENKIDDLILPMSEIQVGKIEKTQYKEKGKYPIIDQSMEFVIGYTDNECLVYQGDLPVLVFGDHTTVIKYIDFPFVMGADGTKVIKPKNNIDVYYLYHAIKKLNIQPQGYRRHFSILKNMSIKLPMNNIWENRFKERLTLFEKNSSLMNNKITSSQTLLKSIINQIF